MELLNRGPFHWEDDCYGYGRIGDFKIPSDVSPDLCHVIKKCVSRNYTDRPRALDLILQGFFA